MELVCCVWGHVAWPALHETAGVRDRPAAQSQHSSCSVQTLRATQLLLPSFSTVSETLCDRAPQRSAVLNTVSSLYDDTVYASIITSNAIVVFLAKLDKLCWCIAPGDLAGSATRLEPAHLPRLGAHQEWMIIA